MGMKRMIVLLVAAVLCFMMGCSENLNSTEPTEEVPEQVKQYYIDFLEGLKVNRREAVYEYCYFEQEEFQEMTADAPELDQYEILEWTRLSDKLWQAKVVLTDITYPSGSTGVNYVAFMNERYYVITGIRQIPEALKAGVDIEYYKPHGEEIIDSEDIIGPIS